MHCKACHHPNADGVKFCEQCGKSLDRLCPACHHPVRSEARFCGQCGHSLSPPATLSSSSEPSTSTSASTRELGARLDQLQSYLPRHLANKILTNRGRLEGERKLVTVLFADIVGYTILSECLGEESLFVLMDELYELFIRDVHLYEGTVNELTGDGIVAFFGAPLAVEQASLRAVRTALALQETIAERSAQLQRDHGLHLRMRVGINTGPVIVGTVGNNLRMDYKAVGNTVNLAVRVEQTAVPNTIRITAQTYKLVDGYIDCHHVGPVTLKGIAEPVQVYQVIGELGVRTRIDVAFERGFTRFVARARELDQLRHCFELVKDGNGQAVSIIGDAGLGKSRLLHEFRHTLASEELTWLEGRCSSYNAAVAYLPLIEVLKQHFHLSASDSDAIIRRKVQDGLEVLSSDLEATAPYLLHILTSLVNGGIPDTLSPEVVRYRIFEALRLLIVEAAMHHPVVLTIEDVHWMDETTEAFLAFLLDHIAGSRVLLLLTYRPEFAPTWSRKSYHIALHLTRLVQHDSYQMLTALLGTPRVHDALARLILDKADGVPFFLEELVKSLHESGAIERLEDQWVSKAESLVSQVPDSVEEVLMARIDRLPEGAKRVLQMSAVIGREVNGELLTEIAAQEAWDPTAHLKALTEAELLYERGLAAQTIYMFKHAFTQEAAYRSLLTTRRRDLHHRVAATLEALFPDRLEEYYGQLAYHFFEADKADEVVKAIDYAMRAGKRHMTLSAYAEAVRFFQMALQVLECQESVDEEQRCVFLLALGEAQRKAGHLQDALVTLQRAADIARASDLSGHLVQAALMSEATTWDRGSSPSFGSGLSSCTISQYPFFSVVCISQPKGPALHQLHFVVKSFSHPVGRAMPNVARNRFKPPG